MQSLTNFVPLYSDKELSVLLKSWQSGGLNGIVSSNVVVVGVSGCDRPAKGFRAETLLERFESRDISSVFQAMARDVEPFPTYGAIAYSRLVQDYPIQDLARAMGLKDCSMAQAIAIQAIDEFVRRLLALDSKRRRGSSGK